MMAKFANPSTTRRYVALGEAREEKLSATPLRGEVVLPSRYSQCTELHIGTPVFPVRFEQSNAEPCERTWTPQPGPILPVEQGHLPSYVPPNSD